MIKKESQGTNDKLNVSKNKRNKYVANDEFEKSNLSNTKMCLENSNQKSPKNLVKSFDKAENEEYFCKSCKNKGCCQICRKIPCDKSIRCSAKSCQKWTHYNCVNTCLVKHFRYWSFMNTKMCDFRCIFKLIFIEDVPLNLKENQL